MKVNKDQAIKRLIIVNEDGTEEVVEKGMIVAMETVDGDVNLSMRFYNLLNTEMNQMFYGIGKLLEG